LTSNHTPATVVDIEVGGDAVDGGSVVTVKYQCTDSVLTVFHLDPQGPGGNRNVPGEGVCG